MTTECKTCYSRGGFIEDIEGCYWPTPKGMCHDIPCPRCSDNSQIKDSIQLSWHRSNNYCPLNIDQGIVDSDRQSPSFYDPCTCNPPTSSELKDLVSSVIKLWGSRFSLLIPPEINEDLSGMIRFIYVRDLPFKLILDIQDAVRVPISIINDNEIGLHIKWDKPTNNY